MIWGLGAAGLTLALGQGCSATESATKGLADSASAGGDLGNKAPDLAAPRADLSFSGADGGFPPIDKIAPKVTQTATFALG